MTTTTSRTQKAPIAIALAMIAGRLEGHSALIRTEGAQASPDKLRLANLATVVEDEATHIRQTAERVVDTLGSKPVTVTFTTLNGPNREDRSVAVRDVSEVRPVVKGYPVYDDGYRSMIVMRGKDGPCHLATEDHETIVARMEGHGLARENRELREALRALVNDATTANRYAARKLLGDA